MNRLFYGMLFVGLFVFSPIVFAQNAIQNTWIEYGPNNKILARAVTTADQCPAILLNNKKVQMSIYEKKDNAFPVTVCQTIIPAKTTSAVIDHHVLPLPKKDPTRIVVIGDTGCLLKNGVWPQACDKITRWPFPLVMKNAAKWHPDLVIHVGDYYYREGACPKTDPQCTGSPHGDNWPTWRADFFHPAKPLLDVAPWIMARGNHENCDRGGEGWTRLLNPFHFSQCLKHSPLYSVQLGPLKLFIIDSGIANDFAAPPIQVNIYEQYLKAINRDPAKEKWIITHKPFWFIYDDNKFTQSLQQHFMNTEESAWHNIHPDHIQLVLSGHVHRFQTLNFANGRPAQVIVGASGTRLDTALKRSNIAGLNIAGAKIMQGISITHFGFMTMEKTPQGWNAQMRDPYGKVLANCQLRGQKFLCKETPLAVSNAG